MAWSALVGASALLIIGVKLIYDVPDDLRYRYSTVLVRQSSCPPCNSPSR